MTTTIEVHEKTDVIIPPKDASPYSPSAVSWGAIFAGAAGAAALSLILLILGTGLGFSAISPWAEEGVSAGTFGISGILWITLTSIAASGMGGYLAGRLRTRWTSVDRDEVYFRDTAHGFLAWGVATLFTACLLTSSIAMVIGGGVKAGANVTKGVASSAALAKTSMNQFGIDGDSTNYFIDSLFRRSTTQTTSPAYTPHPAPETNVQSDQATPQQSTATTETGDTPTPLVTQQEDLRITNADGIPTAEVARIFLNALRIGSLSEGDSQYLAQVVAEHSNLNQQEAEERVKVTYNQWQSKLQETEKVVKDAADEARKTTAYISLWFFIALLVGAFTASWLATYGGRQRDL